jgi:predicted restriction endonuclease
MEVEIANIIDVIKVFKRNGEYAVYKPLLLLIILDEVNKGKENHFPFTRIYSKLTTLMEKHGWKTIARKKAEYPFHFLASSILWETNVGKTDLKHPVSPAKREFQNAVGMLNHKVYKYLVDNKDVIPRLVTQIEAKFFSARKIDI